MMDAVYGVYNKTSSEKVNLKEYFDQYSKLVNCKELHDLRTKALNPSGNFLQGQLPDEDFKFLAEYCSVDNLTVPGEVPKCMDPRTMRRKEIYETEDIPDDVGLQTLVELKKRLNSKQSNTINSIKYRSETYVQHDVAKSAGPLAKPGQDTLIYIRVYNPFMHRNTGVDKPQKISLNCVIVMLGFQTLDKLRDKISCISDLSVSTDVSKHPIRKAGPSAKELYKSGFFYIEDTFYNDFRDPTNEDYSKVIRDWAETRNLGPFKTASMADVRVDSLSVRFGFPWVYQHQASCEHLIVFSDARLINFDDNLDVSSYPRIHRIRPRPSRYCMMCGVHAVRWITTNNDRLPHNPCFFCDTCFKSYNYVKGSHEEDGN
ncbi:snRNA-activating protein complex subunit 3 isoform X2 [Cephus cinctus]|uniref:snRNA-activating protein complex subunit 3 n=1 Tax=Cephus cinctus TaxID=211228 RepID=A0AAJ7FRR4_CEPCN|nr:snRNA-activating protein complex subunit 3 isoform X2 [Cephus cinctus]